jgi:hypothetical protein
MFRLLMPGMRLFWILELIAVGGLTQSVQHPITGLQAGPRFDGTWWLSVGADERSGFINGAADCLTWSARVPGFNATPEQVANRITRFYGLHGNETHVAVVDVWQKVGGPSRASDRTGGTAEVWKNPHWYLTGNWWASLNHAEAKGYLEGYLWCMANRVERNPARYSRSVNYYQSRINDYIKRHPEADDEAVAAILHRFRDH